MSSRPGPGSRPGGGVGPRRPPSRRELLRLALAGAAAAALPARGAAAEFAAPAAPERGRIFLPLQLAGPHADDPLEGQFVGLVSVDPETGAWDTIAERGGTYAFRASPGGKAILLVTDDQQVERIDLRGARDPVRIDGRGLAPLWETGEHASEPVWSPDGRRVAVCMWGDATQGIYRYVNWRFDVDGTRPARLPVPEDESVVDWSADGRLFALTAILPKVEGKYPTAVVIRRVDGGGRRVLVEGPGWHGPARFSPDGRRVAFLHWKNPGRRSLWTVGVDGKDLRKVFHEPEAQPESVCWSPDGRWIAVKLQAFKPRDDGTLDYDEPNTRVQLFAADGRGRRSVPLPPNKLWFGFPDWR